MQEVWRWASRLTVAVGLLCAVASQGWAMSLAEMLTFGLCAGVVAGGILASDGWSAAPRLTRITLWTGAALTAAGGIVAVCGPVGALWLLALVGISPAARYCITHRRFLLEDDATASTGSTGQGPVSRSPDRIARPRPAAAPPEQHLGRELDPEPDHELGRDLESVDDATLCQAWRRSFLKLEAAHSGQDRVALVAQRQRYLDELQRRCPDGVAAWLASGARASSNPMPFLGNGSRGER